MAEFDDLLCSFCICTFIFTAILLLLYLFNSKSSNSNLPPGPKPLPIVGNLLALGNEPHRSLARLAKTYGPIMSLKLGQVTTIVVSSPDLARQVLITKDQAFSGRSAPDTIRALDHHLLSVAWMPASQKWKALRTICTTRLFTSQRLDNNKTLRHAKASQLVSYLKQRASAGEAVDVGGAAFMTSLNLLSNTLFSIDMVDYNDDDPVLNSARGFRDLMRGIMEVVGSANVSDFFPVVRVFDLQGKRRRLRRYFKRLHNIFDDLIDSRLQAMRLGSKTTASDFLDELIGCLGELDRQTVKSLLTDVFVAGSDTSSSTVEWAMAELLRNPESMAKARAELKEEIVEVKESEVLKLPYLQCVVKETLRLHAPIPFLLPRRTESCVELCGYEIPANTRVLVNAWAIGRDDKIWEDADVFKPERFLGRDVSDFRGRDFELIPFGAGRRICPGLPLADRMIHLVLASFLRSFEWKLVDGMRPQDLELKDKFGVTVAMATPIRAIPITDE